jgi:hypothetical protein
MLHRLKLSLSTDFFVKIPGKKNSCQFRAAILKLFNLLNKDGGFKLRVNNVNLLSYKTTTANVPFYTLKTQIDFAGTKTLIKDAPAFEIWHA